MDDLTSLHDGDDETPEYILPLFLTGKTQEIFQCKADVDVTEAAPLKLILKETIFQDFHDRAAISDFHPAKLILQDYPADEVLLVYDPAFKYGQNFYLITSEEQKQHLLNPAEEEDEELSDEVEEVVAVRQGLRTPKPWLSQGSEEEVISENATDRRPKVAFKFSRKRREFGAHVFLEDRVDADRKDAVVDFPSFEDSSFCLQRFELDKGVQHVAVVCDSDSQTEWTFPRNSNTQCEPRENSQVVNHEIMRSEEMLEFFYEVFPRFELALQQNDTMNIFVNDYAALSEEDTSFGAKSDNYLMEYQSFTDLQFSKNKMISSIQWHPTIKGLIAVSCMERLSFYDRVDQSAKHIMTPSLILLWSFSDPIHPLMLLEAPDDILCFQFNPAEPNIVCGGCINGQVVLWDLSQHSERMKNHRSHTQGSHTKQNLPNLPSFFNDETHEQSPKIRYCAVSNIESSHRLPICDILWIPDHIEIGRMGVVLEGKSGSCCQLMTCSPDGSVLFWDTRSSKSAANASGPSAAADAENGTHPNPFRHLDLTWKPMLRTSVHRVRGSSDYSPIRFSISEAQGPIKKTAVETEKEEKPSAQDLSSGFGRKKDDGKVLDAVKTKFYTATEDGEIVYLDWRPTKDIDSGKIVSPKPEFCIDAHDGPVYTLQKSPFYSSILLSVGGWTFAIWKEGVTFGPLFQSYAHDCQLTCGHWSPSRPGVFFIGKSDGNVEVWDILDKSHEPFLTQNVTSASVVAVEPFQLSGRQQLLAVGDEVGTLHIMEVPWNLRHPAVNEIVIVENYLEREAKRLAYSESRRRLRAQEKAKKESTLPASDAVRYEEDAEWEAKAKLEYMNYLEMESKVLESLGLRRDGESA